MIVWVMAIKQNKANDKYNKYLIDKVNFLLVKSATPYKIAMIDTG